MTDPSPGPVVITGASGRIGLVVALGLDGAGVAVRLTDRRNPPPELAHLPFICADIVDSEALAPVMDGASTVVHLAGHPNSRDWATLEEANLKGTRVVFDTAVSAGVQRIVYASSIHVAGFHPADVYLTSNIALRPDSPYGVSKCFGEQILEYMCDQHGITGVALRICSFQPEPTQARHLRTWLSPGDALRLIHAGLQMPRTGFSVIWGLSANSRSNVDRRHWDAAGYQPQDNAEAFVHALARSGVDTAAISEWPDLGGAVARRDVGAGILSVQTRT